MFRTEDGDRSNGQRKSNEPMRIWWNFDFFDRCKLKSTCSAKFYIQQNVNKYSRRSFFSSIPTNKQIVDLMATVTQEIVEET